jgi:hypothetical protein
MPINIATGIRLARPHRFCRTGASTLVVSDDKDLMIEDWTETDATESPRQWRGQAMAAEEDAAKGPGFEPMINSQKMNTNSPS